MAVFVRCADHRAHQQMRAAVNRQAKVSLLRVGDIHPIDRLQVHHVGATETNLHPGLFQADAQQIVDVLLRLLLKILY